MFLEAADRTVAVLTANFAADHAALATAKGVAGVDSTVTIHDRLPMAVVASIEGNTFPAIGVYTAGGSAHSRRQDERMGTVVVVVEYYARSETLPLTLGKQVELAVEAILRTVDRMAGAGGVVLAGDPDNSVVVEVFGTSRVRGANYFEDGCRVRIPCVVQDTGLI